MLTETEIVSFNSGFEYFWSNKITVRKPHDKSIREGTF